jgi:transposase-like protein
LLRSLKARGMSRPRLVIGDGNLGIWAAMRHVWSQADEQRCWNHRIINILDRLPKRLQGEGKLLLKQIPYGETVKEAERLKGLFQGWSRRQGCEEAAQLIEKDWEQMVTFYRYPREHWLHLRTTNPVESPFSRVRLRTEASRRYKKVENATAIIWKTLQIAEKQFRKLNAPELLKEVYKGARYADGTYVKEAQEEAAA